MYKNFIKRILDFSIALVALILFSPLIIVLIILLVFVNKGKPFFFQKRPGLNSKIFTIIKFKTMRDPKNNTGVTINKEELITKTGAIIRKTSLDELLQLVNVLKGDMSLIGPRPLLIEYLPRYNNEQARRHLVKPGITGWAQVNGRNAITWDEKFKLDIYYVDNISFILDCKIFIKTILKVIGKKDINSSNDQLMPEFMGTEDRAN